MRRDGGGGIGREGEKGEEGGQVVSTGSSSTIIQRL